MVQDDAGEWIFAEMAGSIRGSAGRRFSFSNSNSNVSNSVFRNLEGSFSNLNLNSGYTWRGNI